MGVLKTLADRLCAMAVAVVLSLTCLCESSAALAAAPTPAQVEAVFLFNFSQFVDWPPQAFAAANSPIVIGVLGEDPFGGTLDEVVRGEVVNGRALAVRRFQSIEQLLDCQILFISRTERSRLAPILEKLKGRSILTVSDLEGFARYGGMIRFVLMDNKIRLRINLEAAKSAGLTLSSKLLRPAQIVSPGED